MDIRAYKKELRAKIKAYRMSLKSDEKAHMDKKISEFITSMPAFKNAKTLLCYISTEIEVGTDLIIKEAFKQNKNVYIPRCVDKKGHMDFIKIVSTDDLDVTSFGILEPKAELNEKYVNSPDTICIIPALIYDSEGYRLGYGGGYYDRFLSEFDGKKVGIIYAENLIDRIHRGKYDIAVDFIATEEALHRT